MIGDMKFKLLLVLCAVHVLYSADPWTYSKLHQQPHSAPAAAAASTKLASDSAQTDTIFGVNVSDPTLIIPGRRGLFPSVLLIRNNSGGICVVPSLQPCCPSLDLNLERVRSNLSQEVTIDGTSYLIRLYVQTEDACFVAARQGRIVDRVPLCLEAFVNISQPGCFMGCTDNLDDDVCLDNVADPTAPCNDGVCVCKPGFTGADCCECSTTAGFYRPLGTTDCLPCNCCTNGTVGGSDRCDASGVCECADAFKGDKCCDSAFRCGDDTDLYFLIDTTKSYRNHDLCLQTYTLMEIVTALNIGTREDQSLVGTILYPAPALGGGDAPATSLNEIGVEPIVTCDTITKRLEDLEIDIFRNIFEFGYSPRYPARGDSTLPQNAIELLASTLEKRELTGRRIAGILLTDGEHHENGLTLERAREKLPEQLDLIAAGFFISNRGTSRANLEKDLTIIAGTPGNIIIEESIPDLAESIVLLLIQKGIVCLNDGLGILSRIRRSNYDNAQQYCRCLQNSFSPVAACRTGFRRPPCPSTRSSLEMDIMAAVEQVLHSHT